MHDQKRCSKKYKLKIQFFTNGLLANGLVAVGVGGLYFMMTRDILLPIFMGMFAYQAFQALKALP